MQSTVKCSFFAAIVALLLPISAIGQSSSNADQSLSAIEEIVVKGVRSENRQIIAQKRVASGISDFLSANDVGRLPDYNLADAIRRAPGVNTIFDEDEGQFVALRGLNADFVHTTFDGGAVATADLGSFFGQGRRVLLEAVPSGAVGNIAINKTRSVSTDGQALGGAVDLQTRSAFDYDGTYFSATGFLGNYTEQDVTNKSDEPSYRSDITWSTVFGENDEWGFSVTGSFNQKKRDQQRKLPNIVNVFHSPVDGSFAAGAPGDLPYGLVVVEAGYTNTVDRFGGVAKLEFRPTDRFSGSLSTILFNQDEDEQRNQIALLRFCGATCQPTGATSSGLVFAGSIPANLRTDTWNHQKALSHTTLRLDFDVSDDDTISFAAVSSRAQYDIPNRTVMSFSTIGVGSSRTDHSGGPVRTLLDDPSLSDDASDYAATTPGSLTDQHNFDDQDVNSLALDWVRHADEGFGWVAGLNYRDADRTWDVDQTVYPYVGSGTFADYTAAGGSYSIPGGDFRFPIIDIGAMDYAGARAGTSANWGAGSFQEQPGNDIKVGEKVFAAYAGFTYAADRWQFDGGLRYEATDVDARPYNNDTASFENQSADYSNVLPNLNISYDVNDDVVVRAAVSQSLGRPSHSQINGSISTTVDPGTGVTTIASGNIALEPRVSTNFDLGIEYYFDEGDGIFSVAAFYKDIDDEIFVRSVDVSPSVRRLTPMNAESAKVSGLEFLFIKNSLDFLPGPLSNLGTSLNYSVFDGEVNVDATTKIDRLLEQPDFIVNWTLFYRTERFEGRLSWNRTDAQLKLNEPLGSINEWMDAERDFLDAQLRFDVNDRWTLLAEGRNLANEPEETIFVQFPQYVSDSSTFGRSYWIGATFSY